MFTQKKWFYSNKQVEAKRKSAVADGVYFYQLITSDASASLSTSFTETKRMVLIK
jgi:hypothetical protein